jgi:Family of unknown function (DUF6130)
MYIKGLTTQAAALRRLSGRPRFRAGSLRLITHAHHWSRAWSEEGLAAGHRDGCTETFAYRGPSPLVAIENEAPAKLIVDPPLPEPLARRLVFIQYRGQRTLRVVPMSAKAPSNCSRASVLQ